MVCGFKESSLEYLNLNNTTYMYDTYTVIISELKKLLNLEKTFRKNEYFLRIKPFINYLDRNILKGTIMTINYGIGQKTALKNFIELINNLDDNYFNDDKVENNKIVNGLIDNFIILFNILKRGIIEDKFYYNNIDGVKNKLIKMNEINLPDIKMYIPYYTTTQEQIEVVLYDDEISTGNKIKLRYTLGNQKVKRIGVGSSEIVIDDRKTNVALFVNLIHMLDAYYLRRIVTKLHKNHNIDIFTIHDGFAIEYESVDLLVLIANTSIPMSLDLKLGENINSIIKLKNYQSLSIVV